MASLEDKLLGDAKRDNYCSDSDEETEVVRIPMGDAKPGKAASNQTGPKGVLGDFNFAQASDLGELQLEVGGDAFLDLWRQKELKDMKKSKEKVKSPVGAGSRLLELNQETFSSSIDNNEPNTVLIIHVYGDNPRCKEVSKHLTSLSVYYPQVKFCQVDAIHAGMSESFVSQGLPAILVYRGTEVIGSFPNITTLVVGEGNEIYYDELESFLIDNGILFASVTRHNTMEMMK
ncbi:Phosducin-like protein [Oopsacas minuta]|uniref:Phosducin-like protein n=1 Tax=Oopsacas minuta TaxID=111878 RepID=A0AAV7JAL1_9METZ|nr:Phosducin-like protein [Oopsacas minuta]